MSHKHDHLMRSIFQDPLPANIHWREIESLLKHLGADIEPSHGARFKITLHKVGAFLHHPHNSSTCSKTDIKAIREMLSHAGITLSAYEAGNTSRRQAAPKMPDAWMIGHVLRRSDRLPSIFRICRFFPVDRNIN